MAIKLDTRRIDTKETILGGVDKVARYKWVIRNLPGEFHMIDKRELQIDHSYQRSKIVVPRIEEMARTWDWVACGTLVVSLRDDNKWFIIDGQHRKLAADKRSDITKLPCMAYELDGVKNEAIGFLAINSGRVGVAGVDRFHAMLRAMDKDALGLVKILSTTGHRPGPCSSAKTVACIMTLLRRYQEDEIRFAEVWPTLADIHPNGSIVDEVVKAVWQVDKWLEKDHKRISQSPYREKLMALGGEVIAQKIRQESIILGCGGVRTAGIGLAKLLNSQRLPNGFKISIE